MMIYKGQWLYVSESEDGTLQSNIDICMS